MMSGSSVRVGVPFDPRLSGCDRCFTLSRVLVPVVGGTLAGGSRVGYWCGRCIAGEMERIGDDAHGRGFATGRADRLSGPFPNLAPLSGEWSGESVRELLGDLIDAFVRLGESENDAHDIVCDSFESGYVDGFGPVPDTLSVCRDCFDWFAGIAGATESPAGECPAGVAELSRPGVLFEVFGAGDSFGRVCDTCSDALAGARFDVAVFNSGENPGG